MGKFTLKGLPKTLRGVPKIKVTFNIDSNGILTIEACDQKNHLSSAIQIENEKGRLSQREIERMLKDAEAYKTEDAMAREEIIARESLRGYIARLRKCIDDFDESKMSQKERTSLAAKFADVETWLVRTCLFGSHSPPIGLAPAPRPERAAPLVSERRAHASPPHAPPSTAHRGRGQRQANVCVNARGCL